MSYKINYKSTNQKDNIYARIWDCENPKFILQIAHGMCEHIDRYDDFARFLNTKNILVAGNNHLGHGETAKEIGYFGTGDVCSYLISDMYKLSDFLKDKYDLPIYYLGHSMGSFILRLFLSNYQTHKAIIMGTGYISKTQANLLKFLSKLSSKIFSDKYRSKLLFLATIGNYQLKTPRGHFWLSNNMDNVEKWKKDPYCQTPFTNNGYYFLADLLEKIVNPEIIKNTNRDTKLLFVSGSQDCVGDITKGVEKVHKLYKNLGFKNTHIKFFDGMRHEILNENNKQLVYNYIYEFLKEPN